MSSDYPLIVNINQNSLDDGPGIRSVIFFKGCPLRCVWCQNPETQKAPFELSFEEKNCLQCNPCRVSCPAALFDDKESLPLIKRELCKLNFECVKQCEGNVFKKNGRFYPVPDLLKIIKSNKVFYESSNGGVTLSGGEPLMFPEYTRELVKEIKAAGVNVCLETSGHFKIDENIEYILKNVDLIYFDVKIMDSDLHKKHCGVGNERLLSNFKSIIGEFHALRPETADLPRLNGTAVNRPVIIPRTPLIPDITATRKNLCEIAEFYRKNNIKVIDLLPYNPFWIDKANSIGKKVKYKESSWMSDKELDAAREIFSGFIFEKFR